MTGLLYDCYDVIREDIKQPTRLWKRKRCWVFRFLSLDDFLLPFLSHCLQTGLVYEDPRLLD